MSAFPTVLYGKWNVHSHFLIFQTNKYRAGYRGGLGAQAQWAVMLWNPGAQPRMETDDGLILCDVLRLCVCITAPGEEGQKHNLFQEGLGAQDLKATG